ncbi:hypothetical protein [Virgibacillus sp. DJP39]
MVISFLSLLGETKQKLGRNLQQNELEFLRWMYKRYQDEKNDRTNVS